MNENEKQPKGRISHSDPAPPPRTGHGSNGNDDALLAKARKCPFCGARNGLKMLAAADPKTGKTIHRIACFVCFCGGPMAENQAGALLRWNRRSA